MGFLQSIFGIDTGAGFKANGVNSADLSAANQNVQGSQGSQNALLAALQTQNGIGNQNSIYNQMQGTANQYQNIANGNGPNPALAQLAQTTGQNVAQTGALMAGQRGAGSNVGLLARQIGQQGAATQQAAVGQGATLAAQQQLAGLQGLQTQQSNLANLSTQQIGQQQTAAQNAANTALGNQANAFGLQSNINTTNAGIAAGNQKAQAGLIGGVLGSVGAASGSAGGSGSASAAGGGEIVRRYESGGTVIMPNAASSSAQQNGPQSSFAQYLKSLPQQGQSQMTQSTAQSGTQGGKGIGDLAVKAGKAAYKSIWGQGTSTPKDLTGGTESGILGTGDTEAAGNYAGSDTAAGASASDAAATDAASGAATEVGGDDALALLAAAGGQIQPGYTDTGSDPSTVGGTLADVMQYLNAKGGEIKKNMVTGGDVKARNSKQKAVNAGNNYSNDKIPDKVREHTIIVPRKETMGKDPVRNSAKFVANIIANRSPERADDSDDTKVPVMLSEHEIKIPPEITMGKNPVNDSAKFVAAVLAKRRGGR